MRMTMNMRTGRVIRIVMVTATSTTITSMR